jgi:hypothetical protein
MEEAMKQALQEYGRVIRQHGWKAGEPLIQAGAKQWKDFEKLAKALGIMLRVEELLEEQGRVPNQQRG